jgi:ferritin-like metal-binding protein YciE
MTLDDVQSLMENRLRALLAAEKRQLDVLDELASDAQDAALRDELRRHREQTQEHARRLETAFEKLGARVRDVDASALEGLVEERRRFLHEDPSPAMLDAFDVGAAIRAEHLEIAAYEELLALAEQAGAADALAPLRETLDEEKRALSALQGFVARTPRPPATGARAVEAAR